MYILPALLYWFKLVYGHLAQHTFDSAQQASKESIVHLNKCKTDPYFLQNFQCTTMFISLFCEICDLNTEREIVFVLISIDSQGDITQV